MREVPVATARWAGFALVLALVSCSFSPLDLQGRPCPCLAGWRCAETDAGERCVPDVDAGPPDRVPAVFLLGGRVGLVSLEGGLRDTWCPLPEESRCAEAAWDGERFVAVDGHPGSSRTSTNGYTWTDPLPVFDQWTGSIEFGNGVFLTGGGCGDLAVSRDGAGWTVLPTITGPCDAIRSIAFGDGRFVAGLDSGDWRSSAGGQTWAVEATGMSSDVTFDDGVFRDFTGDNPERFRGPGGVCFSSRPDALIRSEEPDCSFPVDVLPLDGNWRVKVFFVDVLAADYEPSALPPDLAACLGR